jgi:hypothetical protein
MNENVREVIKKAFKEAQDEDLALQEMSDVKKTAKDIIRVERNYFYGDRTSNKKLGEIREIIQGFSKRQQGAE